MSIYRLLQIISVGEYKFRTIQTKNIMLNENNFLPWHLTLLTTNHYFSSSGQFQGQDWSHVHRHQSFGALFYFWIWFLPITVFIFSLIKYQREKFRLVLAFAQKKILAPKIDYFTRLHKLANALIDHFNAILSKVYCIKIKPIVDPNWPNQKVQTRGFRVPSPLGEHHCMASSLVKSSLVKLQASCTVILTPPPPKKVRVLDVFKAALSHLPLLQSDLFKIWKVSAAVFRLTGADSTKLVNFSCVDWVQ